MMRYILIALAVVASTALPACGFTDVRETIHRSVAVTGAPSVRVDNSVGAVKVRVWDKPSVDVVATKDAHSADALKNISIDIKSNGSGVTITTVNSAGSNFWNGGGVGYTIMVPAAASLDITNGTGGVDINGVAGNVRVRCTTGGIRANLGKVAGNRVVDIGVTTGGVNVTISRDSSATIDMHAVVGGTNSAFPQGRVGSGTARIHLETTTGGIELRAS